MITTFALLGKFAIDYVSGWKNIIGLVGFAAAQPPHSGGLAGALHFRD
jgi:hypothetical protein